MGSDIIKIEAVKQNVDATEAELLLERVSADFKPRVQRIIYYPYFWYYFRYRVKTIFGVREIHVPCIVDSRNKQAATVDEFEIETINTDPVDVLEPKIRDEEALKIAKSYVVHVVIHRLKSLLFPELELEGRKFLYKPFWIVKCTNRKNESFKVMVDGITGKYQILSVDQSNMGAKE